MQGRDLGKIYVTGADGFIGSHLVETLLQEGNEVTALCIYNSQGKFGWLDHVASLNPKNLKLVLGDVRDPFFLESSIRGHDTVFHLASLIAIPYSYVAPQSYIDTNINGTLNAANAALKGGVSRFIHTSTSEVYGTAQFVPITEKHPLQGQSPYSASKIGADMIVESFFRSFNLPAITLRPFNTYGPRQSLRAVIPTIISQVLSGSRDLHLGNTSPTRDFNYVTDTVAAFIALGKSTNNALLGQTFNAGSGSEISITDLVKLIAEILNVKLDIVHENERVRPELSEVQRLLADASLLKAATGWRSQVSLTKGIENLIGWMKENGYVANVAKYHI